MSDILDFKNSISNMYTLLMLDHVQVELDISFSGY